MAEIVHRAEFPPGTIGGGCYICKAPRRPEEAGVIDCGVLIDYEGVLCLCEQCVKWMAHLIGYPTNDMVAEAFDAAKEQRERASALQAKITVLEERKAEVEAQRSLLMSMIGETRAKKLTP